MKFNGEGESYLSKKKRKLESAMFQIKNKVIDRVSKQHAIDLKDLKLYQKFNLEYNHNFYFTPISTVNNSESADSRSKTKSNFNKSETENNVYATTALRIISPFRKDFTCNCKKTKCLKDYCDCRKNKEMCDDGCYCSGCDNRF